MMRAWLRGLVISCGTLIATVALAAPQFPALTGWVVDNANLLAPAQKQELAGELASFAQRTQHQLVVVTLPELQGYDITDYGYQLGRAWGIGRAAKNDGVLLIVAMKEHSVRIEVGYGLEGTLTDAVTSQILQQTVVPALKRGAMDQGITDGARAIMAALGGANMPAAILTPEMLQQHQEDTLKLMWLFMSSPIGWIFAAIIFNNLARTLLYFFLMPVALFLRWGQMPWLFNQLEKARIDLVTRIRAVPLPFWFVLFCWVFVPKAIRRFNHGNFDEGRRNSRIDGDGGGGFSGGGGGSFGGGGSSAKW